MTDLDLKNFLTQGAILRLPKGRWVLFWDFIESSVRSKSHLVSIFYNNFDLELPESFRNPRQAVELDFEQVKALFAKVEDTQSKHFTSAWTEPSENLWRQSFEKLMEQLVSGPLKKAVPIVYATHPGIPSVAQLLRALLESPDTLYPYGIWTEKQGMVGSSPEILFHRKANFVRTMALAGTWPKSKVATLKEAQAMLRDPKETTEHRLVVDDICSILHPLGVVKTGETQVLELPKLWHLKTEIQVELKTKISDQSLIDALHPTPALGLFPRNTDWRNILKDLNPENTDSFGAPFGMIGEDESFVLVSIRNVIWDEAGSRIGSGCGVVRESQCEKEWQELREKRQSVMSLLDLGSSL